MKTVNELTKDEITSELNALDYKDKWNESDYQYRDKLVKKFYELVELEVKERSSK
jgi:acyl-CoA reductase-like NAD-dependent aldehyde dehydrogenase